MADLLSKTLIEAFSLDGTPSPGAEIALERFRGLVRGDSASVAAQLLHNLVTWVVDNGNGTVTIDTAVPTTVTDGLGMASIGF